jgi:hypothetical protein
VVLLMAHYDSQPNTAGNGYLKNLAPLLTAAPPVTTVLADITADSVRHLTLDPHSLDLGIAQKLTGPAKIRLRSAFPDCVLLFLLYFKMPF